MTEPVAYRVDGAFYNNLHDAKQAVKGIKYLKKSLNTDNDLTRKSVYIEPLYEEEQLNPRVKMKKKQYDRLMYDKENTDLSTCLAYFIEHDGVNKFGKESDNLMGFLKQEDIARAWLNPEETIEIVPAPYMKWFVRSNTATKSKIYEWLDEYEDMIPMYTRGRKPPKSAAKFDTEEEAKLWTNPKTEAVQLPVEGE